MCLRKPRFSETPADTPIHEYQSTAHRLSSSTGGLSRNFQPRRCLYRHCARPTRRRAGLRAVSAIADIVRNCAPACLAADRWHRDSAVHRGGATLEPVVDTVLAAATAGHDFVDDLAHRWGSVALLHGSESC